jgi:hypothetical protein
MNMSETTGLISKVAGISCVNMYVLMTSEVGAIFEAKRAPLRSRADDLADGVVEVEADRGARKLATSAVAIRAAKINAASIRALASVRDSIG